MGGGRCGLGVEAEIVCVRGGVGGGTYLSSLVCDFASSQGGPMALEFGNI